MKICGRGERCTGGHSAVEQSSYISREKMYSEYDGQTYYPKYSEDLVYTEVLLPQNAPRDYLDPVKLWNSVEMNEKNSNAQLARTWRIELPNRWSYDFATKFVRNLCEKLFVSKGMCVQYAIHDSENNKGQRNLHCHIMLTLRGIDEHGKWLPKQRKVYLTDENGERVPVIDKKTGQQKVDKQNRKQWKCTTQKTNDWDDKKYGRIWRKELTDAVNLANAELGLTEDFWEHRSFKEQGLEIIPQIHLGEKASAMERAGIQTIRGDINRDIIVRNAVIYNARVVYEKAKQELEAIKAVPVTVIKVIRNEILDVIRGIAERNNNRLKAPILGTNYYRLINNREALQDRAYLERFVEVAGISSFEEMKQYMEKKEERYSEISARRNKTYRRIVYLESLLEAYDNYKPYIKYHKEQWALKGLARKQYERKHIPELAYYNSYRSTLKNKIKGEDKRILPKTWKNELDKLRADFDKIETSYSGVVTHLACCEVLAYNKRELARLIENENHRRSREPRNRNLSL